MSEYTEVEQPFLQQLAALGWTVVDQGQGIPQNPRASLRQHFRQWLLPEVFDQAVRDLNRTADGQAWLSAQQLDDLRQQLHQQPSHIPLVQANEAVQALLFKAQVDENPLTGEADPVVQLIDFQRPERNRFHAINQFRVDTPGCVKDFIIPDIVLFVNGIPLGVVECKKASAHCANPLQEALEQLRRYMNRRPKTEHAGLKEGEPRLFHSNLLLIRSTGQEADYGTITSGEEHFYAWKTLFPQADTELANMTGQQRLIAGLLPPANLLQVLRCCAVFMDTDGGPRVKVVARYQQFRAAGRIVQRLRAGQTPAERSGVVWHTQGSGKSLTMVFLARMLRASTDLSDYKIVLVNDRQDLEEQLGDTATLIGGKVNVIESRAGLRQQLASDSSDINMVMIHKFQEPTLTLSTAVAEALGSDEPLPSGKTFGEVNPSQRILLMIDEAHRTQSSDLGDNLFEAFPNATRIAFTGTPLITQRHGEKKTHKRFGSYIDTYRLLDAVEDGTTLRILYEGKTADNALEKKTEFDTAFEDLFRDRSPAELEAIKKKYGATGDILEAEQRINAIATDLVQHYIANILPNGFKAQVVCHSKLACLRYQQGIQKALAKRIEQEASAPVPDADLLRQLRFLKTAVIVSSDGTNEDAAITAVRKQAREMNAVENFCRSFNLDDPEQGHTGIAFLIVCDMLLTGFDAPIEQVMYIDKKLREHTLLQAIARTNRVKQGKQRGYIVDYVGLASHLTQALTLYAASDELAELRDGLKDIASELPVLEERYQRLLQVFVGLGVADIRAFVEGHLPDMNADVQVADAAVTALEDEKARATFDVGLKKFLASLDIILPRPAAQPYRVPARRLGYLLHVAKERYKDASLDLGQAGEKVRALINQHLISLGINPKVPPVELLAEDFLAKLNQHAEKNTRAKASEMAHAIRKHCTVHHDEDPSFYQRLSQKVEALLKQHQQQWDLLAEKLTELRKEALAGRQQTPGDVPPEVAPFFDYILKEGFASASVDAAQRPAFLALMEKTVEILQDTIGSLDFWRNPDKQRQVRGRLKIEIMKAQIPELKQNAERVAVAIMSLAKSRHEVLIQGCGQAGA
ncbi:type I deoxyribonuclease HsdR [Vitreoscilla filiformis]|uniref:Type I restriction enzyme endonuclease subunit n=1 Tax=Vitreoscilla filiformis TaxID=63 RepID=A0A221KH80_VITFI|nr:HsdR family type I site-specific deoxyribonuclease [Vitreoscilla filiformis]ASM78197.1 type I deoxyribonuclease HsdR [Vitreoscilla filiformis]